MLTSKFIESLRAEVAFKQIVTQDPAMLEILNRLKNVAPKNVNILLNGETGTGKELCAQAIHFLSPQRNHPFIALNCGIGPVELFDSILFGHTRGAFTNAIAERRGLIEEANHGILFLDEINSLPQTLQVKLNRFIETGNFRRLGENRLRNVNVRIIAASNTPLTQATENNSFRKDLYYRLAEYIIDIPPLRQRNKDIRLLLTYYLQKFKERYTKPNLFFTEDALKLCEQYDWPGNVRELENLIKRCCIDSVNGKIQAIDLKIKTSNQNQSQRHSDHFTMPIQEAKSKLINEFEISYLHFHLKENNGNVEECARQSGKHRSAFWALLKKHNIDPQIYRH